MLGWFAGGLAGRRLNADVRDLVKRWYAELIGIVENPAGNDGMS